jgi:hypothetical protein
MTDDEIGKLFAPLFDDLRGEGCFPNRRPLLTHYTSIVGLEDVLSVCKCFFMQIICN